VVAEGELLDAGGQAAVPFEPPDGPFDHVASSVEGSIEARAPAAPVGALRELVAALRYDQLHVMAARPGADRPRAVALIAEEMAWAAPPTDVHRLEQAGDLRALVDLTGGQTERRDDPVRIAREVKLRPPAATGSSQSVVSRFSSGTPFFRAPAAACRARIEVPSTHQRSQSTAWRRVIKAINA